jgi:hypothetical protein
VGRTIEVVLVERPWQEGDVAYNQDGKIRFVKKYADRLIFVDRSGHWQANVNDPAVDDYTPVIRGGVRV